MNCPSCTTPLEPNARFCGVCGYRLQVKAAPPASPTEPNGPRGVAAAGARGAAAAANAVTAKPVPNPAAGKQAPRPVAKPRAPKGDEIYINTVLNNRFKIESKIGEGGFGAVYRGVQLATGRKVALKLLHPEMTKDDNLVARFRREGMVLCNLRDAHTITTYDFDQTPDGTLYIAMELLEGKSLHQLFHEQAPLEWKRVFKILTEMCSSLAEAHAQGIVHRDLKPENVYLEKRPGNDEFVKILDFGIAKVMRGDAIDPASPQLTATGQTLGTLEYMSPEQLMGKALDGRSDVYALGVVAYEMTTGQLPFPNAKGPAGLITAQLKQTPQAPSSVNAKAKLSAAADRAILKCLEKDKNNRFADVTALAAGLQEALDSEKQGGPPVVSIHISTPQRQSPAPMQLAGEAPDLLETRRGPSPTNLPPPAMPGAPNGARRAGTPSTGSPQQPARPQRAMPPTPGQGMPQLAAHQSSPMMPMPNANLPYQATQLAAPQYQMSATPAMPQPMGTPPGRHPTQVVSNSPTRWMWWVLGLLVLGAAVGAVAALVIK